MKKSKITRIVLSTCMILALSGIIFLESSWFKETRNIVVDNFMFLSGKRAIFSNILLGIFSSAFCMFVGECVAIYNMRQTIKQEIEQLFKELWLIIYIRPGDGRASYIQVSHQFLRYQNEIQRLYKEYDVKDDRTGCIIKSLNALLLSYRIVHENEIMIKNNFQFFLDNFNSLNLDIPSIFKYSIYDDQIMSFRNKIEKMINDFNEYQKNMNQGIDESIEMIQEIEKYLDIFREQ